MIRPQTKRTAETVSSVSSMTLFLIFTVCCLILITVAASAYSRISSSYNDVFNSAAAVKYVTNKLRSCDSAELLSDNRLIVRDKDLVTLIYEENGTLYERLFPDGAPIEAKSGEVLFPVNDFSMTADGSCLIISAGENEKTEYSTVCRIP